ncbi:MAG: TetR/AcrR family transcriptional regulator [Myxococcales bacterium]|nr:TetR/AcrR family transcriptional regulator [Myxococcales bacterium]MCB9753675.1 TetR/AcrR family transcriptional regulator [Myxococcales bacterium]
MTPPTRAEQKEASRRAILEAARARFLELGYEHATIRDIARAAGVSSGSVLAHFGDKRGLLLACFLDNIARAQARIWATLDERAPLLEQLTHCARVLYTAYAEQPTLSRVMFQETLWPRPQDPPDDQLAPFLERVAALFRAAKQRGELTRLPGDGFLAAQGFFALYLSGLIGGLGGHFGEHASAEANAAAWVAPVRALASLQLTGLGARAPDEPGDGDVHSDSCEK